jgi:hypothetical protein
MDISVVNYDQEELSSGGYNELDLKFRWSYRKNRNGEKEHAGRIGGK